MRFIRTKAVVAGLGLALSLAACGDAGDSDDDEPDVEVADNAADELRRRHPDEGARRRRQDHRRREVRPARPRLQGRHRRHARRLRRRDRQDPRRPTSASTRGHHVEGDHLRQPRAVPRGAARSTSCSRRTPSPTSAAQVVGQAGPYFITGQQLLVPADSDIETIEDLKGKEVCSVTGSTSLENIEAEGAKPRRLRHLLRVRRPGARRHRRRDDDRRRDPARLRRPEPRRAQGRRRAVLRGAHRRRLLAGPPGDVPVDQRHPRPRPSRTARGRRPSRPRSASRASRPRSRRRWTSARPPDRTTMPSRPAPAAAGTCLPRLTRPRGGRPRGRRLRQLRPRTCRAFG